MGSTTVSIGGFSELLSRSWVWGRRLLWVAAAGMLVLIVVETIHLHGILARIHTGLAWGLTALLVAALVGWPAWIILRYARVPRALSPPALPTDTTAWTDSHRARYRRFAIALLRRQRDNPHLDRSTKETIPDAIRSIQALPGDGNLETTVRREVDRILAPIDAEARRRIRRASVEVALATAVSPSILLDSLITLTRNLDLIAKLAELYYGRPGLLGTLRISRDVLGSAIAAGALEVVTDHLSGALTEMAGAWSSRLVGPLGQGMVNGVVTMRLGAGAQWRCRSLTRRPVPWLRWGLGDYRRAIFKVAKWVKDDAGPTVFGPLDKFVTWTGKATDGLVGLVGSTVTSAFRGKRKTEEPPLVGDPVLDGGFLD